MALLGLLLAFLVAVFFLWVSQTLQRSSVGKAYGRHGAAHFVAGDDDGAILNFTESILTEPTAATYLGRGAAYFRKGHDDGAIADFTEAIRISPSFFAYFHRGGAYFEKGDHERAISDYTDAIRFNPKCAEAYAFRGKSYARLGDRDSAFADAIIADRIGIADREFREEVKAFLRAAARQKQAEN